MISILHDCCYQTERYIVYFTNRYEDASDKCQDMRDELEHNAAILRVFGPQRHPLTWNQADWTTLHGVRVRAAGAKTQVRGITEKGQRPTKVVIDDVEHWEHVENEEQRIKTWRWLTSDVLKLGQPITSYEVWGTILNEQAMLKTLLQTPGWTTRFYQSVLRFADVASIPLWQEWRALYVDLSNPTREEDALAFFQAHEADMLRGSEVLWPSRRSYYDLMVRRLREGETSWWQELMNQPLGDERHIFDMDTAAYCEVRPSGILRAGGTFVPFSDITEVVAAWDPTPPKDDIRGTDFTSCAVVAQDREGYNYLIDAYIDREVSMEAQLEAVIDLLWKWSIGILGIESNSFASLIPGMIREKIKQRALAEKTPEFQAMVVGITNLKSKILRIKSLESLVANGWLQFSKTLDPEMFRQFREWLPIDQASHDDGPDSVEMAIRWCAMNSSVAISCDSK